MLRRPTVGILIPDLRIGGAERVSVTIANYLKACGFRVTFYLMEERGELLADIQPGIRIISLDAPRLRYVIFPLMRELKTDETELLFAVMWPLSSIAALARTFSLTKVRLVLIDQVFMTEEISKSLRIPLWLYKVIVWITYRLADRVIVPSAQMRDDLHETTGLSNSRLRLIPNPASLPDQVVNAHYTCPYTSRLGLTDPQVRKVLTIGTLKAQKNHRLLIDAFCSAFSKGNAVLVILGDGELRIELEDHIRRMKRVESIILLGAELNISPWLQHADLFVLSSDWEGLPTVLINALDYNLSIVSTDCKSGPSEILNHGEFGQLVPTRDLNSLANAMRHGVARRSNSDNALRLRAKEFSIERIGPAYEALIYELTNR